MAPQQDPFLWDVDAVVDALCVAPSSWTKDPVSLAAKLREEEFDGKTLLTFAETCSRQELMECLGIRLARHKVSLTQKLVDLCDESKQYRQWLSAFRKKTLFALEDDELVADEPAAKPTSEHHAGTPDHQVATEHPPSEKSPAESRTDGEVTARKQPAQGPERKHMPAGKSSNEAYDTQALVPTEDEPPLKRRRMQPINLSQKPQTLGLPWERQPEWAYIGTGSISSDFIKSTQGKISTRFQSYANGDEEIFEMSDLPSELDEETLREMEEERMGNEENERLMDYLTRERVREILDSEVERMTAQWKDTKLAQRERLAYKLWTSAARRGSKAEEALHARSQAKYFHNRIQALSAEILGMKWQVGDEVQFQAQILEPSLKEKLHALWLADTLESRVQPPKPPPAPRKPKEPKPSTNDPELLTSSDYEDDLDDFIVSDQDDALPVECAPRVKSTGGCISVAKVSAEEAAKEMLPSEQRLPDDGAPEEERSAGGDHVDEMEGIEQTSPATPIKAEKQRHPQVGATRPGGRSERHDDISDRIVIDLTSPGKPQSPKPEDLEKLEAGKKKADKDKNSAPGEPPSLESLGTLEAICAVDRGFWNSQNDRWRLEVWDDFVIPFISDPPTNAAQLEGSDQEMLKSDICRIFLSFVKCKAQGQKRMISLSSRNAKKIRTSRNIWFDPFCAFIKASEPIFPHESQIYRDHDISDVDLPDDGDEQGAGLESTPSRQAAAREIIRNKDAVDLREHEKKRAEEQEARRKRLQATLADSGLVSQDKSRLIINDTKEEGQSLIYVNDNTSKSIKDHQVKGVRFLWNQIILDTKHRHGCLLAHTMGLGKTMQVITFLVAVADAAKSSDPSVASQIPKDLRTSQTIVLCPSGLVDNWMDELLKWAPSGSLGPLTHLDAVTEVPQRLAIVRRWAEVGGVLVIGYNMLLNVAQDEEAENILLNRPSMVVADEAHRLKNRETKLNSMCSRFKTTRRIALTGSPLANNVEEYYSMIDWVSPNFLGPLSEFREVYVRDIQAGLDRDSPISDRRRALKVLQVLKATVAAKVDRATIKSCLAHDLPPKAEPTPDDELARAGGKTDQAKIFSTVNNLGLICNHPRCFHEKLLEVKASPDNHPSFPHSIISAALRETKRTDNIDPLLSHKVQYMLLILDQARAAGDKVLVFTHSRNTLNYLENLLKLQKRAVCRLDGSTKIDQRQERIRDFNAGSQEVYLISTTAGGVGLNIQGANRIVIFDSKWNPVDEQQAVGRAYRIGQRKTVFVYHLVVAGTFEEAMQSKSVFKTQLASRVVDKKNPIAWGQRHASLLGPIKDVRQEDLSIFVGKDRILDSLIQHPPGGSRITKIVSTDTFEEEDEDTNLTAQEQREAQDLLRAAAAATNDEASGGNSMVSPISAYTDDNGGPDTEAAVVGQPDAVDQPDTQACGDTRGGICAAAEAGADGDPDNRFRIHGRYQGLPHSSYDDDGDDDDDDDDDGAAAATAEHPDREPQRCEFQVSTGQQGTGSRIGRSDSGMVTSVMWEVDKVRKAMAEGFLPDDQQWRTLNEMMTRDRFALAVFSGLLSPPLLATAPGDQLRLRAKVLDGLSKDDFTKQLTDPPMSGPQFSLRLFLTVYEPEKRA
ncbi:Superfamily II DNA or RNA helicase, SNF2 family [Geosmithia morbida]|uniref:Superfamily II DNA or RNA helicase, SNF2 family n=1 Tax=Geosmithia morbida TaxID=1094350 RepID=A0A9P5D054_9HYPO|nr:Superfamily II DNA or RNA helicase, SNF2 family [Geosmithia morbida]KAF4121247.1 Superfamily II DNA or RNA helicase, SNF2 family [Geosmithia morbida]